MSVVVVAAGSSGEVRCVGGHSVWALQVSWFFVDVRTGSDH